MPHLLHPYRDRLNALIGPLEQIEADIDALISEALLAGVDMTALHYAGVTGSKIEIENVVAEIDEFEEPAPEPVEPDLDDGDDGIDEEDEDDEEFTEDELDGRA